MTRPNVQLGDLVKDSITGYTGVAVGIYDYLNGCRRIGVQAKELKDGKPIDSQTFDVEQLEIVEAARKPEPLSRTGGPQSEPARRSDPGLR